MYWATVASMVTQNKMPVAIVAPARSPSLSPTAGRQPKPTHEGPSGAPLTRRSRRPVESTHFATAIAPEEYLRGGFARTENFETEAADSFRRHRAVRPRAAARQLGESAMFMFAETPVRFVGLLLLFAGCTLWCIYELTRAQDSRHRVSNALHLVMAVVMLLMVAPMTWNALKAVVPTLAWVGVFALSTAWFVWLAIDALRGSDRHGGLHFFGHAAMFAAMTWHLSAMAVTHRAKLAGLGADWTAAQRLPGGVLWLLALVGLPLMTYLLISSFRSLWQAAQPRSEIAEVSCGCEPDAIVREPVLVGSGGGAPARLAVASAVSTNSCHEVRPVGTAKYRLEVISAFAMNFGMFWMSTGLLVPILPFFSLLAF